MSIDVFRRTPHINDLQIAVRQLLFQLLDTHLLDRVHRKSRFAPTLNTAIEVAFNVLNANACKTNYRLVNLSARVGDNNDRSIQRNQASGPHRELPTESDVRRTGNVTSAEVCRRSHVEQNVTCIS